jgi:hypothetical protein
MESRLGSSKMLQQDRRDNYSCTALTNKRQIVFGVFGQLQAWRIQQERSGYLSTTLYPEAVHDTG